MWKEFNLINSFTLECSFCGPTSGLYKDCHFTITMLKELGKKFCLTLIDYAGNEAKVREAISELEAMFPLPKANGGGLLTNISNANDDYNYPIDSKGDDKGGK